MLSVGTLTAIPFAHAAGRLSRRDLVPGPELRSPSSAVLERTLNAAYAQKGTRGIANPVTVR
jgi:hypothetical protein